MALLSMLLDILAPNPTTAAFVASLAVIFLLACIAHVKQASPGFASFGRSAGTSLVSIGVLGTFVGIFIGLQDFDPNQIDKSIPPLLNGLKIAFVTSIVGMFLSVVLRFYQASIHVVSPDAGVTPEDINRVLTEIRNDARDSTESRQESLASLQAAIAGEGEATLVTQLQKLRTSFGDQLEDLRRASEKSSEALIQEFREFSKTMAENNSKALIEALNDVIRDFNQNLTEQFGDNFKQLNEAVVLLVTWQEQYKVQVEQMSDQFARSVVGIEQARGALVEIASKTQSVPRVVEGLDSIVRTMSAQLADLQNHLEAFATLRDKAVSAFPEINRNIQDLTVGFSKAVTDANDEVRKTSTQLRETFERATTDTYNVLVKQVETLDSQMQAQLIAAIERMGSHLASLSSKFVEDYTPLTDKLRDVVEIANRR